MNINEIETLSIKKFLLHELDEDSAQALEERFFTEPDFHELVLMIEDEIFEDYVLDILSRTERGRVEQYLLSTSEQKKKLDSIANLVNCVKKASVNNSSAAAAVRDLADDIDADESLEPQRQTLTGEKNDSWLNGFWMRLTTAALVVIVVGAGIYLVWQKTTRSPEHLSKEQAERIEKLNREYIEPGNDTLQAKLEPMVRGSQNLSNQITLSPGKKIVELNLQIPSGNYESYRADFKEFEGTELAIIKNLQVTTNSQESRLKVRLPADVLKAGVYSINISGETNDNRLESVREFVFEAIK